MVLWQYSNMQLYGINYDNNNIYRYRNLLLDYFVSVDMVLTSASVLVWQVSILLAIELIWNLCEVLFIDAAPG